MNDTHYTMDFNKCLKRILEHYLGMLDNAYSSATDTQSIEALESEMLDVECMMEIFCR